MSLVHEAEGNSASGQPQHRGCDSFDCFTERYEIVLLLPNSELSLQMVTRGPDGPEALT